MLSLVDLQIIKNTQYLYRNLYMKLLPLDSVSGMYFSFRAGGNIDIAIVPAFKVGALHSVGP